MIGRIGEVVRLFYDLEANGQGQISYNYEVFTRPVTDSGSRMGSAAEVVRFFYDLG